MLKLYGFTGSGNCNKVAWTLDHLAIGYDWVEMDVFAGDTGKDEYLELNPAGQVPLLQYDDGRTLSQSDAIMLYVARDSDLVPGDPWRLAQVYRWLFWEQNTHEPSVAVCRADLQYRGRTPDELDAGKVAQANRALDLMQDHLDGAEWLVEGGMTVATVMDGIADETVDGSQTEDDSFFVRLWQVNELQT